MVESTWIWMKGSGVTINDPIALPTGDDRPGVKGLIAKHRDKIDALQKDLKGVEYYDAGKHDDLWLLRFLLSHNGKHKPALKAIKYTLNFRAEYELDKADIRLVPTCPKEGFTISEGCTRYLKYCEEDTFCFCLPDPQRGVVAFIKIIDSANDQALLDGTEEKDFLHAFMYSAEWSHQWLDYVTRTTGRLTKSVRLVDASGLSIRINREKTRRESIAMNVMEDCYPQMLEKLFACNPPSFVQILWRIVRVLIPKRVVQKVDILSPSSNEKEKKRILRWISEENLPAKFGGTYQQWPPNYPLPGA